MSTIRTISILALTLLIGSIAHAGDLNPPPGLIAPTNKTQLLAQSITLPYTISDPGSYVLTSNLVGVSGEHGLIIEADNVTIDLAGFSLMGVPGSLSGISVGTTNVKNLTVKNGNISGWGANGIHLSVFNPETGAVVTAQPSSMSDLKVSNCAFVGISPASQASVKDCAVDSCSGGIFGIFNCQITRCIATNNATEGIQVHEGSVITECSASSNGGIGIVAGSSSVVRECSTVANGFGGIQISRGSQILNCAAERNVGFGLKFNFAARISGCTVYDTEGDGILGFNVGAGAPNLLVGNHIVSSSGWGINAPISPGNMIFSNYVLSNAGGGINAPDSDAPVAASSGASTSPRDNIVVN